VIAALGFLHELAHQSVQLVSGQLRRGQLLLELFARNHGQSAGGAGQIHHTSTGHQQRKQRIAHGPQGKVIDPDSFFGLHAERFGGGRLECNRSVVDQHVDARVAVGHELGERGHAAGVGHVQLVELGLQAQLVQLPDRGLAPADVPGRQVNIAVEPLAQGLHDGVPDALVAARHYCQSSGRRRHVCVDWSLGHWSVDR